MKNARRLALAALALTAASCTDPVDKQAKKRIFSPEEPAKVKLAAAEPLDTTRLSSTPALAYHVITMGAGEALERLGAHRFHASASYEWKLGDGAVKLSEERQLDQLDDARYALKTDNDQKQGVEIVRAEGRTFERAKYGKFRERKRDRGQAEKLREDVFGALRTAEILSDNKLGIVSDGADTVGGRSAMKFSFTVLKEPLKPASLEGANLPPVVYPQNGPDAHTKRRIDFSEKRALREVEGSLWVDTATGVPLKSELTAHIVAPGEGKDAEAQLTLKVATKITDIGASEMKSVAVPAEFLPDDDRPNGIAAALERFEVERQVADGGTPEKKSAKPAEKPPEEDE